MGLYSQMNTGGGGSFLDLPDDKMVRVRILDFPYVNSQSFTNEDGSITISTKFTWEVWDYESASVKLLSKGSSIFNQIRDITELQGEETPAPFDIGIKKTGSGMATRYSVVSAPIKLALPNNFERIDIVKIIKNAVPLSEAVNPKSAKDRWDDTPLTPDTIVDMPENMPEDFLL